MTTTANVFQNYIGGKWQGAQSGQTFPNYNPATGELLGHFPLSGEAEANAGVAACITPWNFPIAIPTWKMFPALIAGNTVVIKPASDTPLSALHLVETLYDAGLPEGVVNIVFGPGSTVGEALLHHPVMSPSKPLNPSNVYRWRWAARTPSS